MQRRQTLLIELTFANINEKTKTFYSNEEDQIHSTKRSEEKMKINDGMIYR